MHTKAVQLYFTANAYISFSLYATVHTI